MNDLCWGHDKYDNEEVDWYDDRSENSKRSNRPNVGQSIREESYSCRAWSDQNCIKRAPKTVGHPSVQIICNEWNVRRLTPGVTEHEDVIRSDAQNNEDCQLVQRSIHCDLKYARIDQVWHWKAEKDEHHRNESQKEALQVEYDVEEDKTYAKDSESDIAI